MKRISQQKLEVVNDSERKLVREAFYEIVDTSYIKRCDVVGLRGNEQISLHFSMDTVWVISTNEVLQEYFINYAIQTSNQKTMFQ